MRNTTSAGCASGCATMRCLSRMRRRKRRRSRLPFSLKTEATAALLRRRSRARCSITTCWAKCRKSSRRTTRKTTPRMISRLFGFLGRHIDRHLLAAVAALMLVCLITLYSASAESLARVAQQLANIVIALGVMWLAANIPPHYLQRLALPVYVLGLVLLFGVAAFGEVVNGARRWLHVGVTRIQPSEVMKGAVPMALAWYFDRY